MKHKALKIVHDEHQAIGAMLQTLRILSSRLSEKAKAEDFELVRAILFYIDEFPEKRHHANETNALFPRLRLRSPEAAEVLDRLEKEHSHSQASVRELEHLLLAFEQMGESRHKAFSDALEHFIEFYAHHMQVEETEVLPLADRLLNGDDWDAVNAAFEEHRDPLTGHKPSEEYQVLFEKILERAPAPIGLGKPA
jgi:hemerythrin-like domain-containing protein